MNFGIQFLCHQIGDWILQSHWMAVEKTKSITAALIHAVAYTLPFLIYSLIFFSWVQSSLIFVVVAGLHFFIDHYRLAIMVSYWKNKLAPKKNQVDWEQCHATGYPKEVNFQLSLQLMFSTDQALHYVTNYFFLYLIFLL